MVCAPGRAAVILKQTATKETTMSRFRFRPRLDSLDDRCLPSGNPLITIDDASLAEGNAGQTALVFTVHLSKASSKPVTVTFATAAGTAEAGSDFVARAGSLTFAPGETTRTIAVLVN